MTRAILFAENEYYHIYNRGTDKRKIFMSNSDYSRFTTLLYACNGMNAVNLELQGKSFADALDRDRGQPLVDICAYCLMPNHFHLVLREISENGISKFMQKLGNAYTGYFNKNQKRVGSLFEGTFKATHAHNDRYLKYLVSYVHLNPIKLIEPEWKENGILDKQKARDFLDKYRFSSFLDYCRVSRGEHRLLSMDALPAWETSFSSEVTEWLEYNED